MVSSMDMNKVIEKAMDFDHAYKPIFEFSKIVLVFDKIVDFQTA